MASASPTTPSATPSAAPVTAPRTGAAQKTARARTASLAKAPLVSAPATKPVVPSNAAVPSKAGSAAKVTQSIKVAKPGKSAKVAAVAKAKPVKAKPEKIKPVRDSFTFPKNEYLVIDVLKKRAVALGHPSKKSELLRAGIKALSVMSDTAFAAAIRQVPAIKTGRPGKG